jgi:peptide/nickel transport system substrate-binding protein
MKLMRLKSLKRKWNDLEHGTRILFKTLNKNQKNLVITLLTIMVVSSIILIIKTRNNVLVVRPIPGGTWSEGLVGNPRFINPVLAVSNIDKDLSSLVYSGLVRRLPNGTYTGELADSYEVDSSGLVYTFVIKDDAKFHDGEKVTTDDVIYTIDRIKDPLEKSPRNVEWQGVTAKAIDEQTITLTLKQPFSDFLDIATIGILPKHVYGKYNTDAFAQAKENINAIGSGPYEIKKVNTKNNLPTSITLVRANGNQSGYIKKIIFNFYENEQSAISALTSGNIDHLGSVSAKSAKDLEDRGYTVTLASFPRLYGMFFNTKQSSVLSEPNTTEAINSSIDRQDIINNVLDGFGNVVQTPLPTALEDRLGYNHENVDIEKLMTKSGWKKGDDGIWEKTISKIPPGSKKTEKKITKFSFVITTSDTPELRMGAEQIASALKENGILASVASFDTTSLEEKIRTRDYEALYYGIQVSRESQVYAFWHSSQREHPGLNIAGYTNPKIDTILEALQKETSDEERINLWEKFMTAFENDTPAVFIYSPSYIYIHRKEPIFDMPKSIHGSSDRFSNVKDWYLQTERVIPFLYKKSNNNGDNL